MVYLWDMGDLSVYTDSTVGHSYTSSGQYIVQLIVTDTVCGTKDSVSTIINIPPLVSADIVASPDSVGCIPFDLTFTNNSNGVSYIWDFDDGSAISNATSPSHTFTTMGSFNVSLIATDSSTCNIADTTYINITVGTGNPVIADFSHLQNAN